MQSRYWPALAMLLLVVVSGLAHGLWTHRWTISSSLDEALTRLDRVPMDIGDWEGINFELDQRQLEIGQIDGYLARRYRNRQDGREVTVLLVCGLPGPIAVHTPDICYAGAGYTPASFSFQEHAGFKTAEFRKEGAILPESLRIYWSWSDGELWEAPDHPRHRFMTSMFLYKIYVIDRQLDEDRVHAGDVCKEFIRVFLPELSKAIGSDVRFEVTR
jgi:hypothetical protein